MGTRKEKKRRKARRKRPSMAEMADRHELYQKAVQRPEADIDFYLKTF